MSKSEQFRNLLMMAAADGRMDESELRLLSHRATEWGITDDEFEAAIHYAISGGASLTIPSDPRERKAYLKDMIRMMAADGVMAESEKNLFAMAATMVGIEGEELNQLIDEVLSE